MTLFLLLGILVPTAAFVHADMHASKSAEYHAWFEDMCQGCTDSWALEYIAWKWKETIAILVASLAMYHFSMLLILRIEMWSPVFIDALKKLNV
eukprot:scaffold78891_cov28-Prasinocladus_malaysianus.AAC.1